MVFRPRCRGRVPTLPRGRGLYPTLRCIARLICVLVATSTLSRGAMACYVSDCPDGGKRSADVTIPERGSIAIGPETDAIPGMGPSLQETISLDSEKSGPVEAERWAFYRDQFPKYFLEKPEESEKLGATDPRKYLTGRNMEAMGPKQIAAKTNKRSQIPVTSFVDSKVLELEQDLNAGETPSALTVRLLRQFCVALLKARRGKLAARRSRARTDEKRSFFTISPPRRPSRNLLPTSQFGHHMPLFSYPFHSNNLRYSSPSSAKDMGAGQDRIGGMISFTSKQLDEQNPTKHPIANDFGSLKPDYGDQTGLHRALYAFHPTPSSFGMVNLSKLIHALLSSLRRSQDKVVQKFHQVTG